MKLVRILPIILLVGLVSCESKVKEEVKPSTKVDMSKASQQETVKNEVKGSTKEAEVKSFKPFYIYSNKGFRDNHYIPSGFMPNGKCLSMKDTWRENCYEGKTCIKFDYDIECSQNDQRWAGVYWLKSANNWGRTKSGYDLTGAEKLTFWARGEKGQEQIQEFIIGGIEGKYPDSDKIVFGPVILKKEWRKYTIDLRGRDISYISGGFAWSTDVDVNPDSCTFYLDEIRFE